MSRVRPDPWEVVVVALVEAFLGLLIAVVALAIVFLTPLKTVTADVSQRLFLAWGVPGGALGTAGRHGRGVAEPPLWAFVDLGPRLCGDDSGGAFCPPRQLRTDRMRLADVISRVDARHPRLVIVDVRIDGQASSPEADKALRQALRSSGGPVLLSWAPEARIEPRADGSNLLVARDGDFLSLPGPGRPAGLVRYYPALRRMSGPVARQLSPDYDVVGVDGVTRRTPGIAYAAAMVLASPRDDPWRLMGIATDPKRGCERRWSASCRDAYRRTDRLFSFAPVSGGSPNDAGVDDMRFRHLTPAADSGPLTEGLRDSVVIIGDSRLSAGDRTWTAVGDVSGAEIILNDVRQYLIAQPAPPVGFGEVLSHDAPILAAGTIAIIFVQSLLGWFLPRPPRSHAATLSAICRDAGQGFLGFLLTVLTTAAICGPLALAGHRPLGVPPDVVAPFLAISLETAFEFLHIVVLFLHAVLYRLLSRLRKVVTS